jgi:peptide/nickel transport system ATP-binding protein
MPLLEVNSLKMYYEIAGRGWVRAIDDVSMVLKRGATFGLAGESGCGKTSLGLTILRLLPSNGRIFGGNILFDGRDLLQMPEEELRKEVRWKRVSMVFQGAMSALNPVFRVGDQIAEAILIHEEVSKEEARERVGKLLELVGIDPSRYSDYPHELSGGMRQRVMIAMALACNPDILIADEPTTALDVIVQAQILKLLKDLQKRLELSLILISHDISLISEVCDEIAIMYAGKIMESGPISSLFNKPLHPYTVGLLASIPSVKKKVKQLQSIPGNPPDLLNPPLGCRFHPRCPHTIELCKREEPKMEVVEGRLVACHRVKEWL